jgi:hypothetical protein
MLSRVWPAQPFARAVAIFFALILLALGFAAVMNAPLSYDGAFYLFSVLDSNRFSTAHGRLINFPLQLPVLIAMRLTQDMSVLRVAFSTAYASIPLFALAVSWFVCRSRRPSLFIWPAMSICIAGLPGQFAFQSEAMMAVTLLWPALLAVLIGASPLVWPWVAITSIAAAASHPYAGLVLALIVLVALVSAIVRPESRKRSVRLALGLGVLLLARILAPLDSYESGALSFHTIVMSLNDSVIGWPLVAIALTMVAALSCLLISGSQARICLIVPLSLAGAAMVVWAIQPALWALCLDYRYWVAPVSLPLMTGAAVEELWLRRSTELQLQEIRRHALSLIGAIFLLVLTIQSLQWGLSSRRLANELMNSDHGCVSRRTVTSVRNTALDFWSIGAYAVELQGRRPRTLMLAHKFACRLFALDGDAILVDNGTFSYMRRRGEGWFDFEDARSRTVKAGK